MAETADLYHSDVDEERISGLRLINVAENIHATPAEVVTRFRANGITICERQPVVSSAPTNNLDRQDFQTHTKGKEKVDAFLSDMPVVVMGVQTVAVDPCNMLSFNGPPVQVPTVDGLISTFEASTINEVSSTSTSSSFVPEDPSAGTFSAVAQNCAPAGATVLQYHQRSVSDVPLLNQSLLICCLFVKPIAGHLVIMRAMVPRPPVPENGHGVVIDRRDLLPKFIGVRMFAYLIQPIYTGMPMEYRYFGRCDEVCHHCHALFWREERIAGLPASAPPQYHRCCAAGRAVLRAYPEYPPYIRQLFSDRHFMENIRAYNQMFAMTSFGATVDNSINTGRGPYVFRVSGQIYHFIGGLCPMGNRTPRFLQLYIYDTANEIENRLSHFDGDQRRLLREDIVQGLIQFLDNNNALVRLFRTARDKMQESDIPEFKIRLFGVIGANQKMSLAAETNSSSDTVVDPVPPQRELAYFTDLNPTDNSKFIEARVYRKWTAMKIPSLTATKFSCILLDKKGSAIQANAELKDKERFERDLQINCVYRIQGFGFEKTDEWEKTLDNDITLTFGKYTQTDPLQDGGFPYHYFNFAAYNELGERLQKKAPVLTDYIGYVHNVEKSTEYGSATTNKVKVRNIAIRNLKYNQTTAAAPRLEVQTERLIDWEQERTRNRVSFGTLLQIDPNTQQRVLFTADVMILRIDTTYDWYFQKCDECGQKLEYGFIHGQCHQYGTKPNPKNSYCFRIVVTDGTGNAIVTCFTPETDGLIKSVDALLQETENKDPKVTPAAILALQNTRHVLQFRFAKAPAKGPPTFLLKKVMDNPPLALHAPSEEPSSPIATPTDGSTTRHFTPPPATPNATQDTLADSNELMQPSVQSSVRKELFASSDSQEATPQAKKQKNE
ncbi:hypothetical protein CTI12_AA177790 [Artemisia annua]|uniref:Replication protein A 70 kDa DNA-binding subunit B/D first OB fold domain-containing protein n=1 Tax=Artemisia annua TaxID=35608 RepID=A0A2U1P9S0_ARTAN|nr:hypothetical protein CTI12_AA177790 [Artemisia annua]